jgi:hypothetical protein
LQSVIELEKKHHEVLESEMESYEANFIRARWHVMLADGYFYLQIWSKMTEACCAGLSLLQFKYFTKEGGLNAALVKSLVRKELKHALTIRRFNLERIATLFFQLAPYRVLESNRLTTLLLSRILSTIHNNLKKEVLDFDMLCPHLYNRAIGLSNDHPEHASEKLFARLLVIVHVRCYISPIQAIHLEKNFVRKMIDRKSILPATAITVRMLIGTGYLAVLQADVDGVLGIAQRMKEICEKLGGYAAWGSCGKLGY